jgi:hypothetical protein
MSLSPAEIRQGDMENNEILGITYKCQKWLQEKCNPTNVEGYGSKILEWLIL